MNRFSRHYPVLPVVVALMVTLVSSTCHAVIGLTLGTQPDFGMIVSGASSRNFILNTNNTISGTHSGDYISGAIAGQITVTDNTSPVSINILANNISTFGGLTINQVLCSYNGGAQAQCDGSGINPTSASSAALKIGLNITTSQSHSGGNTASVTMDVTVTYL